MTGIQAYDRLCTVYGHPNGCNNNRIRRIRCGSTSSYGSVEVSDTIQIMRNSNTDCKYHNPPLRDTIKAGANDLFKCYVEFDNASARCYGIVIYDGKCWGNNPNGGNYNCQG